MDSTKMMCPVMNFENAAGKAFPAEIFEYDKKRMTLKKGEQVMKVPEMPV